LVLAHGPFVWRVLRHHGVVAAHLDDLVQEVFLVVVRRFASFEGRSSIRSWIYGICRNVASDARRRSRRKPELLTETLPEPAVHDSETLRLARSDARTQLRIALAGLPETTRMVLVLYEVECFSMTEVAEIMGCRVSTAYTRLYAARRFVRAALEARGVGNRDLELALGE
jgi:RNA polymerase sigma-70 factor (ECF subfamily)